MGIGTEFPSEKVFRSDLTINEENPVFQLTQSGTLNHCMYFTHPSYIPNTHDLIFTSDRVGGIELFKVNIDSGIITQLTEKANVWINCWGISPSGKYLIYFGGTPQEEFHLLDLGTLQDELLFTRPQENKSWWPSIIDVSPDGDSFYMCSRADTTNIPSNLFKGSIQNREYTPIFDQSVAAVTFFDHQMLCPTNPHLLQFNKCDKKYFGGDNPQRMSLLDLDSYNIRPVYRQKKGFFSKFEKVGHESWCPDGKHLCFVVRRNQIKVCNIENTFGQEVSWTAGKGPNFWHVTASPNGDMLLADTNWEDKGLWCIEFRLNQQGRLYNLCLSKSDWQHPSLTSLPYLERLYYQAHPHPAFSPDGRFAHFTAFQSQKKAVQIFTVEISKRLF
jgi:oligogalacturonide lyase